MVHVMACILLGCACGIWAVLQRHTLPRPPGCAGHCPGASCARSGRRAVCSAKERELT
jgi:hypothetical protein